MRNSFRLVSMVMVALSLGLGVFVPVAGAVPVPIPDGNLEAAIRAVLNKPAGDIEDTELATITRLPAVNNNKNGWLNGSYTSGTTQIEVFGLDSLLAPASLRIAGDNTAYTLSSRAGNMFTITPGLSTDKSSGTLVTAVAGLGTGISDLTGLEYCTNLGWLDLTGNNVSDLSPIAGLPLYTLYLSNNNLVNIGPLATLTSLNNLSLLNNKVVDISPLASLTNMVKLTLWQNDIVDISALSGMTSLQWLDLRENNVNDLTPLTGLTTITGLALDNNPIGNANLLVLAGLTNLEMLALNFASITNINNLQGLTNLHMLALGGNNINGQIVSRFAALVNNAGLDDGDYVFVGTAIGTFSADDCTQLAALRARGVIVDDLDVCGALDRTGDRDGDGLPDYEEVFYYADPTDPDTDDDGMPDGWEVDNGLNPRDPRDADYPYGTTGRTNLEEYLFSLLPVPVPDVVGKTQAAATTDITAVLLKVGAVSQQTSNTVPAGRVISQNPIAGTGVARGSAVDLVISLGDTVYVQIPNVVNQTQAAATTAITGAGLTLGTVTQQNSYTIPLGSVVSQNPAAGVYVPEGTLVNIVISLGPPIFTVPNVLGQTQAAATTAITGAGLTLGGVTQQYSLTVPLGRIISQTPTGGTVVAEGSAVDIVVSLGEPIFVTVPYVVGMPQAAATALLVSEGLTVGTVTELNSSWPAGTVFFQDPADGEVFLGTAVNLLVSTGDAPQVPAAGIAGLLALVAAVGAAGAVRLRRRQR
ncbi:MAG: PASTA domain-containing protein [Candidatus Hydrogenedentes bacterium]|nr:PASTA domain-containing protein [Candidatus Hydrogenedentota bacterium]